MPDDQWGSYREHAGNKEPKPKKCNALLVHWESRYGEPRYCARPANSMLPADDETRDEHDYCKTHKQRYYLDMRAKELMQHGLFTETVDHCYGKLDPWQQIFAWGCFESLLADSHYEYAEEFQQREFDFGGSDTQMPSIPADARDGEVVVCDVPLPTENPDRAVALWLAAVDSVKMINVQAKIANDEMETKSTEYANFTTDVVPSESGGEVKSWQTIEEVSEHHLNLPYSRLVRDRKELLKYGGVAIEGETTTTDTPVMSFNDFADDIASDAHTVEETPSLDIQSNAH